MTDIPDDAMQVQHGTESEHENYVRFTVTDVLEWYTVTESGEVKCEKFISDDPSFPEDISAGLSD